MNEFKQHLFKTIDDKYTVSVLQKFSGWLLNEGLSLELKITYVHSMLSLLNKMQHFNKYKIGLENMQKELLESAQNEKNKTLLESAIAMNTIIVALKKSPILENDKFYRAITSAIEFLEIRKEKLQSNQAKSTLVDSVKQNKNTFFVSPKPLTKQPRISDEAKDIVQETTCFQKTAI